MPGKDDETVNVELPEPPALRVTVVGFRETVAPEEGTIVVERVTVPENPFRLLTVIVDVPDDPDWTVRADWLLETLKSGASVTVTVTVVEWTRDPEVPVMVTL